MTRSIDRGLTAEPGPAAARPAPSRRHALVRLRCEYFAHAWDSAGRYAVDFEEIVLHLWRVRRRRGWMRLSRVRHIDDLVHVVACARGASAAWADLVDRYEGLLVRRCAQRVDEMESILTARRLVADLRRHRGESLLTYAGERPLRAWLTDRVLARLGRAHSVWCMPGARSGRGTLHRSPLEPPAEMPVSLPFGTT